MTPTEAYRAALEAAATIADGMKAPIQDAANIAIGLPAFSKTVAALIRALPVPEGLDDADELDSLRAENERLRGMSPGVAAIATERQRQIAAEIDRLDRAAQKGGE